METVLGGTRKAVIIGPERPTVLIGERINPTGKKRLAAALAEGDLEIVRQEAEAQVEAGADVLDVNVGAAGVDEVDLLPKAVRLVMETVEVPVCIDTTNIEAKHNDGVLKLRLPKMKQEPTAKTIPIEKG